MARPGLLQGIAASPATKAKFDALAGEMLPPDDEG
jgi:hypothetical protein